MMNVSNKKNGIDGKESSQSKRSIQEAKGTRKHGLTTDLMIIIVIIGGKKEKVSLRAKKNSTERTFPASNRVPVRYYAYTTTPGSLSVRVRHNYRTFLYYGTGLSFLSRLKVVEEIGFLPSLETNGSRPLPPSRPLL
jgi:hypothetical protein